MKLATSLLNALDFEDLSERVIQFVNDFTGRPPGDRSIPVFKRVVDRYLTAKELADDLDRFVRRRRFLRPLLVGAGGLLMVAVFLRWCSEPVRSRRRSDRASLGFRSISRRMKKDCRR